MQLFRIPYNNNEMMKKVLVLVILSLLSTVASAGKIPHRRSPSTTSASSAHEGDVIRFELGKLYLLVYHHRNLQDTHAFHGRPSLLVILLICIRDL